MDSMTAPCRAPAIDSRGRFAAAQPGANLVNARLAERSGNRPSIPRTACQFSVEGPVSQESILEPVDPDYPKYDKGAVDWA
jgi:hypothetical protein